MDSMIRASRIKMKVKAMSRVWLQEYLERRCIRKIASDEFRNACRIFAEGERTVTTTVGQVPLPGHHHHRPAETISRLRRRTNGQGLADGERLLEGF
jgi:hypothetical protein